LLEKRRKAQEALKTQGGGQMGYQQNMGFKDVDSEILQHFALQEEYKNLKEKFPGFENKKRKIQDFEDVGTGLNRRFLNMDKNDLLEFLLCALQKDDFIVPDSVKLDENDYTVNGTFKDEFGNIGVRFDIRKFDDNVCVLEFSKTEGALMSYYDKVKMIKSTYLAPLTAHYQKKQEAEK
jgi:hypothetical protein